MDADSRGLCIVWNGCQGIERGHSGRIARMSEEMRRRLDYLEWVAEDMRELDDAEKMELDDLSAMFYGREGNPNE
jgi:hypothetical protein